jgi:hypothetical protein
LVALPASETLKKNITEKQEKTNKRELYHSPHPWIVFFPEVFSDSFDDGFTKACFQFSSITGKELVSDFMKTFSGCD